MDNAASRLLEILEKGRDIEGDTQCVNAWRMLFPIEDNIDVAGYFGDFLKLSQDAAKEIIGTHPDESDSVNHWKSCIFKAIYSVPLNGKWADFQRHIDRHALNSLRSQAKLLHANHQRRQINSETLQSIRQHLTLAAEKLSDSNIDDFIKTTIGLRIDQVISCINRYRFCGSESVIDAAKLLAADISILPEEPREAFKESSAFASIKESLSILSNATTVATALPQITTATAFIIKALG